MTENQRISVLISYTVKLYQVTADGQVSSLNDRKSKNFCIDQQVINCNTVKLYQVTADGQVSSLNDRKSKNFCINRLLTVILDD